MKVRIGYGLGVAGMAGGDDDAAAFAGFVDDLERLRFDSLWLSERLTGPAPDPLVGLAVAAGRTTKLKLGTSVLVVPGRNPALLASELASLDRLSRGRLLPAFGLGVADPAEQQAFGVDRGERAAIFDEVVPLLRRFWLEDVVDHDGPRYRYDGLRVGPKPAQQPPDVWLGGLAPSELRRCGRLGDGWLPSFCTPDDAAAGRRVIEETAAAHDRAIDDEHYGALLFYVPDGTEPPARMAALFAKRRPDLDPSQLLLPGHKAVAASIEAFVDKGFSKFVLVPFGDPPSWSDELAAAADALLPLQT